MLDIILFKIRRKDKSKSYYIRNSLEEFLIYLKINNKTPSLYSCFLSEKSSKETFRLKDNETQSDD